jgi:hypothetical protein
MRKQIILAALVMAVIIAGIGAAQVVRAQDPTIPTRTPTPDGSIAPTTPPISGGAGSGTGEVATPTADDSGASPTGALNLILPLAGLLLIGVGVILALLARNRRGDEEHSPD